MVNLSKNEFANNCTQSFCLCDFRINLLGCRDEKNYQTAIQVLIPFTFMIVVISISFLYYRVKVKGQSVFFPATRERGMIRPRPQDSFHIAVGVFNFSQMIVSTCLLTNSFPNIMTAEIVVYVPKLLGVACAALYPISIIYSTPIIKPTTYYLRLQWNPSKVFIDGLAMYLMLGPLLTTMPLSAITGYFADKNEQVLANKVFVAHTFVWSLWTIQYDITLLYVYYKLICMLKEYISILNKRQSIGSDTDEKIRKLNSAAYNLSWIVFAVFSLFFITSIEGILVGFNFKQRLMDKTDFSSKLRRIVYFLSWNFTAPVFTFIGQIGFLYDTLANKKTSQHNSNIAPTNNINLLLPPIEQKPSPVIQPNIETVSLRSSVFINVQSKSAQQSKATSSTAFYSSHASFKSNPSMTTNNSKNIIRNNSISLDGNATISSTMDQRYQITYLEEESENMVDDEKTSPDARNSWLRKKPVRMTTNTSVSDKSIFLQD
ncbi:3273_t:CDS:2 [Funneliformis geosporum]|nr:3273_t:CDS:2 [Funneliformis geosporum]